MRVNKRPVAPRGVALINALVLVAALSAITVTLLQRVEQARTRLSGMLEADQLGLYLDAAEQLAFDMLTSSGQDKEIVHLGQAWARPLVDEPIDRGTVSLRISDLQGRFNLAWLNRPVEDEDDLQEQAMFQDAFEQLMQVLALDQQVRRRLTQALDPELGQRVTAWGRSTRPPDLPLTALQQMRLINGVNDHDINRLAPYMTSLPTQAGPNLNTMSPELLAAFLPDTNAGTLAAHLNSVRPFQDYDTAIQWVEDRFGEDGRMRIEALDPDVASNWFELRIEGRLGSLRLARNVVLTRDGPDACCRTALALPEPD